jgi:hypothetical protein
MAIDREADDLVVSTEPALELEEKQSLAETLTEKSESGEGNARLERRIQRKEKREQQEMFDEISKNLPPLESIIVESDDTKLPALEALPPLPALENLPALEGLPSLPALEGLPPLPQLIGIAPPQRDVTCSGCEAKFTVKDMTRRSVTCPICSQITEF